LGEEITKWWARGKGEDPAPANTIVVHREVPIHVELTGSVYVAYVVTPVGWQYLIDGHCGDDFRLASETARRMLDLVLAGHELIFSFDGDICVLVTDGPLPHHQVVFENPGKKRPTGG
jgi:hypothetical protein